MAALAAPPSETTPLRSLPAPQDSAPQLSGLRKAAILLASLSHEAAAAILQEMSEEEVRTVSRELAVLPPLDREEQDRVLREFLDSSGRRGLIDNGGFQKVNSILVSAFGPEAGKRLADQLLESMHPEPSSRDLLRQADPDVLARVVQSEHPQTIALVLCQLETAAAAQFLRALPAELKPEVTRRAASLEQVSPEVLERLTRSIRGKLSAASGASFQAFGGVRTVADLLNQVDADEAEQILQTIGAENPQLDQEIRRLMFVFDDLINVSPDSLRALVGRLDRKVLTVALKGSNPELKKKFTSLMSSRAAEMLAEDMQALGPVRIKDVEEAQQKIIATVKQMEADGLLSVRGGAEEFVE
ncbi:MAG: flagellar motor switch protein FliG [Acidobacteria bacterium]|nr:flagellar motor switch protein FliG [Acidobacteriota bacterium]